MPLCHRGWHRRPTAREHRGQGFRTRGGPAPASPARAPSPPPQAHTPARPQPITPVGTPRDRAEPARETPAIREPLRLGCFLDWWVAESLKQVVTLGLSTASLEAMALSTAPALPPCPKYMGPRHSARPAGQSGSGAELPFPGHPQGRRGPQARQGSQAALTASHVSGGPDHPQGLTGPSPVPLTPSGSFC